jgi:hypothetical protein
MKLVFRSAFLAALVSASAVTAAPIFYDDRDAFVAATSPQVAVDFDDVEPVGFSETSAVAAGMSFSGPVYPVPYVDGLFINSIRGGLGTYTVNGTQAVFAYTTVRENVRIDFLNPVIKWGATFKGLGDVDYFGDDILTRLAFYDSEDALIGTYDVSGTAHFATHFRGVDLNGAAASYMVFDTITSGQGNDVWTMDDVLYSTGRGAQPAPVPLPASALLLGTTGLALGALRRRART